MSDSARSRAFANRILDRARAGEDVSDEAVNQALRCLGDIPREPDRTMRIEGVYRKVLARQNDSLDRD